LTNSPFTRIIESALNTRLQIAAFARRVESNGLILRVVQIPVVGPVDLQNNPRIDMLLFGILIWFWLRQYMHKNNSEQKLEASNSAAMSEKKLCDYI